jgi:uncharacterized protein (DUF1330 family)
MPTSQTTPVYMIVNADIHDPKRFAEYGRANAALVKQFGGKYLVLGGARETLEGEWWDGKSVISEWESREAALAYWHSPAYAEVRKLREGICDARVVLVDGFPPATVNK